MFSKVVCTIFVLFPASVFCAERGSACETPYGEVATCTGISSCKMIERAVMTRKRNAIEFAKSSGCGFDNEPLVCCGSTAIKSGSGSSCTTPNRETGTCTPLASCKPILDATATSNKEAIEFAKMSRCNNTEEHLVCCGSEGSYYQGSPLLPKRTVCGIQKPINRVTGGELTEIGEFRWMALLRYKNFDGTDAGFKCGGTLINNRYVLTAAHCVTVSASKNFALYDSIRLGEWKISTESDCEDGLVNEECADPVVDVKIERTLVHSQYHPITKNNDIALVRLERNVAYTAYITPICLPHPNSAVLLSESKLTVAGWGATENSPYSDVKLKAEIPVVSMSDCSAKIRQGGQITDRQICAGGASNKDSCKGDSGGPLMGFFEDTASDRSQLYQEGIVSWGTGCGIVGVPAVYTRVAMFTEWIIENLSD